MPTPLSAERWARLEALFLRATEIPASGRTSFVEAECGPDTELRDELLSLLRYDTAGHADLEAALGAGAAHIVEGEPLEGRALGAYRIERELGRGGMSVVYLAARDDGEFRKLVAVKLIKRGMDTDAVMERLRRERHILAALEHPYIARLLDGGTTADGRPYIVMEYVDGQPVDRFCEEQLLTAAARCELFEKICAAVSFAHRNLVVHRDLKPANILITADGAPRLLDFGVAKVLTGDPVSNNGPETRSLSQALTPEYASPEQRNGAAAGTATDVYSLGVVLHEVLTGARPDGDSETASAVARRMGRSPRWAKQIEGDLDTILRKAIDPDPERRYHSVEQFESDLRNHRLGRPIAARRDSIVYRAGKFVRRHTFGSAAAACAVFALTGGLGTTLWQARVARDERDDARKGRAEAERQRVRAQESAQREQTARSEAESERARAEVQKTAAETERALADHRFDQVRELARKFATDIHDAIAPLPGSTAARRMLVETGLHYYDSLAAEARGNRSLLEEIARGYDRLGDAQGNPYYANLGDRPAAMASYRKAEALRSQVRDNSPEFISDRILGEVRIAQMLTQKGDLAEAAQVLDRTLKLGQTGAAAADYMVRKAVARALSTLGDLKNQSGNYSQAVEVYENLLVVSEALAQEGRDPNSERSGVALAHTKLGECFARMEKGPEALAHLRPAVAIDKEFAQREPNSIPRMRKLYFDYVFMSWVFRDTGTELGTEAEARDVLDQATAITAKMAAADPSNTLAFKDVATAQTAYAGWLRERGDHEAALDHFRRAADAVARFTAGRPHTMEFDDTKVEVHEYLGRELVSLGKPEEALTELATASDILGDLERQNPGLAHLRRRRAEVEASLGSAWILQKNWQKAIDAYKEAVAVLEEQIQADPKNETVRNTLPGYQSGLADSYFGAGRDEEGQTTLQAVVKNLRESASHRALSPDEARLRDTAEARLANSARAQR